MTGEGEAVAQPNRLPERSRSAEVEPWRDEMRTAAIAAAGGLVAGAATVAALRAVRSGAGPLSGSGLGAWGRRPQLDQPPASSPADLSWLTSTSSATASQVAAGARAPGAGGFLEVEVRPPWPYRLPAGGGGDAVMRVRRGMVTRLLHVEGAPVVVRAVQGRDGAVLFRADGATARRREGRDGADAVRAGRRRRLSPRLRPLPGHWLLGTAIRRRRWHRPRRRPWPWEALAWAITQQLIESSRAAAIQRRMVYRWGVEERGRTARRFAGGCRPPSYSRAGPRRSWPRPTSPRPAPGPDPRRARGRRRPDRPRRSSGRPPPAGDPRDRPLDRAVPGPPRPRRADSLPAGDLAFVKLVGRLTGRRRYATIEEVEEFFAPHAPYRGLAGSFVLAAHHKLVAQVPPLRLAAA